MLRLLFPYLLFGFLLLVIATDHVGGGPDDIAGKKVVRRDPICNMDVGLQRTAEVDGVVYAFCSEKCRKTFVAHPEKYLRDHCPVCKADRGALVETGPASPAFTWQGRTYRFCSAEHRDLFAKSPADYFIHSMWGIPSWLYGLSIGILLVLTFGLFEVLHRIARKRSFPPPRPDLFRIPYLLAVLRWPPFRFLAQLVFVLLFLLIVLAGLFGNQLASKNVAPLLTWTIWWGGLVVLIMFLGKAWCYVCPWDAIAGWIEKLKFFGTTKNGLSLGLPWPKALRNILIATIFFVGLTWLELGFGVTMDPRTTALLGLLMLGLAVVSALIFERRAFCRYACLVGRVSGLYAMFAATELRPKNREVCKSCTSKDCYHGNERGDPCPTGLFPAALSQNTYCIDCFECVKSCPEDNFAFRLRPWAADLAQSFRPRKDEAYLALLMLAITGFHGLTMTPAWREMLGFFERDFGLAYLPGFSLGMALLMVIPILIYAALVWIGSSWAGNPNAGFRKSFLAFAYSVLPIALFYHLAHNSEHLLMEGQKVLPLLSNPFGFIPGEPWNILGFRGTGPWDIFGTADLEPAPLVTLPTLWIVQVLLILIGHIYSLWVADRTAHRLHRDAKAAFKSQVPMLAGMVLFSIFSLWLLKQPMEMRTSAM